MGANHNIGKSIDKKLQGLKDTPDEELWGRITTSLDKKKKRPIPIWWLLSGIGLLLLMFTLGFNFFSTFGEEKISKIVYEEECLDENFSSSSTTHVDNNSTNSDNVLIKKDTTKTDYTLSQDHNRTTTAAKNSVVVSATNSKDHKTLKKSSTYELTTPNYVRSNKTADSVKLLQIPVTANNYKAFSRSLPLIGNSNDEESSKMVPLNTIDKEKTTIVTTDEVVTNTQARTNNQLAVTAQQRYRDSLMKLREKRKEESLKKRIAYQRKRAIQKARRDSIEQVVEKIKWSTTVKGIGVQLQNLGNASSISPDYNENEIENPISIGYGAALNAQVSDKLQLSIGVNYFNLSQTTRDIATSNLFATVNSSDFNSLRYIDLNNDLSLLIDPNTPFFDIRQELEYIQIPMTARLRLFPGKISVHTHLGFSYLHVLENEFIYLNDNEFSGRSLGSSNRIDNSNFTVNAGLGAKIELSNNLNLVTEAVFNYQFFQYSQRDIQRAILQYSIGIEYKF